MKLSDAHVNYVIQKRKKSLIQSSTIYWPMKGKDTPVISAIKKSDHNLIIIPQRAFHEGGKDSCDG